MSPPSPRWFGSPFKKEGTCFHRQLRILFDGVVNFHSLSSKKGYYGSSGPPSNPKIPSRRNNGVLMGTAIGYDVPIVKVVVVIRNVVI